MKDVKEYYQKDNDCSKLLNRKQVILNNVETSNSFNEEFSQFIRNFYKMDIIEIEPTTQNINEIIFEDLSIIINELFNLILTNLNKGKGEKEGKKQVLEFINNYKSSLQEIYSWLLNNQINSDSIYLLGYFNYHGIGTDINKQNSFELYQKSANLKNTLGIFSLGKCYELGSGIDVNKEKAFELYHEVADLGNPHGIYYLGWCYDDGVGTEINKEKAFKLYQKAADLGHIFGMNNLGYCYDNGVGTVVNKKKAFELFHKAAMLGYEFSQYNLALMYEVGDAVEKNVDLAIYWFKKSAEQGDKDALNKLNKLLGENFF
ncbi:hypothetical protein RclHR1_00930008 [Rhizophagus clarus]|uniref:Kinase-like domain-containing protein n=1 Tax=Rhizophagus clarus TaxID=94130 RepID=A0A2Z6SH95_9GLOM|nr:hypothetical protein RclHR1_00930008 [Rhizophagus clarus]GES91155.1 kinase-like domain-containing protein [Rhizophagus clarus]